MRGASLTIEMVVMVLLHKPSTVRHSLIYVISVYMYIVSTSLGSSGGPVHLHTHHLQICTYFMTTVSFRRNLAYCIDTLICKHFMLSWVRLSPVWDCGPATDVLFRVVSVRRTHRTKWLESCFQGHPPNI